MSTDRTAVPRKIINAIRHLLLDRRYFAHFVALWLIGEAVLSLGIIKFIPYTNIDWLAYLQQVATFRSGERRYSSIEGGTGPLVYPALHLYIYTALSYLLPPPRLSCYSGLPTGAGLLYLKPHHTDDEGCFVSDNQVKVAQIVWAGVWVVTCGLVGGIYFLAGSGDRKKDRKTMAPPQVILPIMTLSKRLHSIYVLRLFNDPLAMMFLYASVMAFQLGKWEIGSVVFSLALGVKMNILLFVPGLLVVMVQYRGIMRTIGNMGIIVLVQIILAAPFLANTTLARDYFRSAFDFSRAFLFEWSVNWNFVGQEAFASAWFSKALVGGHLVTLFAFAWSRWSSVVPGGTIEVIRRALTSPWTSPILQTRSSRFHIAYVLFTSNLVGITFSRSLHYQFLAWYAHQLPLLLWCAWIGGRRSKWAVVGGVVIYLIILYAWNAFPPSPYASASLLVAHVMMLLGVWVGKERIGGGFDEAAAMKRKRRSHVK